MSEVNKQPQVGGTHYRTSGSRMQHWDMCTIFKLDYFQGQITKYVLRWKHKYSDPAKKLEDLKKARQFLDKYIEDHEQWVDTQPPAPAATLNAGEALYVLREYDFTIEDYRTDGTQLYKCGKCGAAHWHRTLSAALQEHGDCPGKGYVAQG